MVTKANNDAPPLLSLIVPMHNEEPSMDAFFEQVLPILEAIDPHFEIITIDDGSRDKTLEMLKNYHFHLWNRRLKD